MPARIRVIRRPFGLVPATKADAEALAAFPLHEPVTATLSRGRSARMARFYEALVGYVADGIGEDREELKRDLKIKTGRVDSYIVKGGALKVKPRSTATMDHSEFKAYLDAAIEVIIADYLPQMSRMKFVREVERMAGLTYEEANRPSSQRKAA